MIRDLLDEVRESVVTDSDLMPVRTVTYTQVTTNTVVEDLNAYVGAGQFNKEEKETLQNMQSFGGLKLDFKPSPNDTVLYDENLFIVKRYAKIGALYTVYCEQIRHSTRGVKR